jgi:DNA-binding Lrp family transcriptional regulator
VNKTLNADAWRAEIERYMQKAGDDGMTSREIAEHTGLSSHTVSVRLAALFRQGRIRSGKRYVMSKDGAMRLVPVYVIVKEKKK